MTSGFYRRHGKRLFDLALAVSAVFVLLPVLAATAGLVRLFLGNPALFLQSRPGLGGRPFRIMKFRTMTDASDAGGTLLSDEVRLTRFGKCLRATSLDELPELWNIIRGEMSFIGPRPLLTKYLELYSPEQARRHEVRPGLTGWAQIHGRNALDWESRFCLDVWYVDHCSFWLDLKILWMTVAAVFGRKGISAEGHSTMPEFEGTRTSTRQPVLVIGAGGHGKVVVSTLQAAGIPVDAVYDDNPQVWGTTLLGVPVRGPIEAVQQSVGATGVLGIGSNFVREHLSKALPLKWLTVIHPRSFVHPSAVVGEGTLVFAGAVIQPDARIGAHAIINTGALVDHDCTLEDYVHLGPGGRLAGGVRVGAGTALGTGSVVIPGVEIGRGAVVGAGTTVIADLPDNVVAVGSPARIIKSAVCMRQAS